MFVHSNFSSNHMQEGFRRLRSHLLRRSVILTLVILITMISLLQLGNPVSAHFNTLAPDTDVKLHWPLNNSYSVSVDLKVLKSPESNAAIFWGHQFSFMNGETGYVALGVGGNPKVATVGVFDAIQANPYNSSGACSNGISFLKTGVGWQCFVFYDWRIGFDYKLQFSRIADANGTEQWQGSVYDYSSNSSTIIGTVLVPPSYGELNSTSSTWDEYSLASSCNTTPTRVVFSYPYAMNAAGDHAPAGAQVTYGNTSCQDSNVQYLSGGAYQADAGNNVTRTTQAGSWLWTQEPSLISQDSTAVPELQFTNPLTFLIMSSVGVMFYFARNRNYAKSR